MSRRFDDMHPEDRGCPEATEFLKRSTGDSYAQSKCTECPFPECIEVKPGMKPIPQKHLEILALSKSRVSVMQIAKKVGVHHRTVQRVVRMGK